MSPRFKCVLAFQMCPRNINVSARRKCIWATQKTTGMLARVYILSFLMLSRARHPCPVQNVYIRRYEYGQPTRHPSSSTVFCVALPASDLGRGALIPLIDYRARRRKRNTVYRFLEHQLVFEDYVYRFVTSSELFVSNLPVFSAHFERHRSRPH